MPSDESSKRGRGCMGCGGCLLAAVVVPMVVLAVVFLVWSKSSSNRVEAELAAIREAGEPCTPEELDAYYRVTDAEERTASRWLIAAESLEGTAYDEASANVPIVGGGENEIPPPGQPWADLQVADEFLQEHADVLAQFHKAAESGAAARYSADFSQGVSMALDHIQPLRAAARLLRLEAHVRAHRGDVHGAANSIYAIFMLADSLKQEPIMVSQLVRSALDDMAQDVLQLQLPTAKFSDEDLDRLQAHLRKVDYGDGLQRAMIGQRVMGIQAIEDPSSAGLSDELPGRMPGFLRRDNLIYYLRHMSRAVAASKQPMPEALDAAEEVDDELNGETENVSLLNTPGRTIALYLIPAINSMFDATARRTASARAVDAVIAVERFRRENARVPKTLEELVPKFLPQVPIDPYDGRPLRYVVRDGQYVIYSVGKNAADDGGHGDESCEPDLVFPVQLRKTEEEGDPGGKR